MMTSTLWLVLWLAGLQATPQQPQPGQSGQRGTGGQPSQPRQQPQQPQRGGTAAGTLRPAQGSSKDIVGTVLRSDTLLPLSNVRIQLGDDPQKQPTGYDKPCKPQTVIEGQDTRRFATSDAQGRFTFENASAAQSGTSPQVDETVRQIQELERLRLQAELGIVSVPQRGPQNAPDMPLIALDDAVTFASQPSLRAEREGFVQVPAPGFISMAPAPTISGRVMDPNQQPVAAAVVEAYAVHYTPLGRSLKWVKSTLTNDLGDYRLSWLPFGPYYVVAGHSNYVLQPWTEGLRITPNLPEPDLGLPLLFYPGVVNASDAQLVRLVTTGDKSNTPVPAVNLVLRERPRFNVKVRLVADPMPSNPNLVFLPHGGDLCAGMDYAIKGNGDGTFEVRDVPEGLYVLVVMRGRDTISELMPVNVNKNIDDLKLPAIPPNQVRGTITFTDTPTGLDLGPILDGIRVNLTRAGSEVSHVATTLMDPNTHNFAIPGMGPGLYYPTLDLPRGSYVKNIRVMRFNRVPGVAEENLVCDGPTEGVYSYLTGNGHLQPLEIPRMMPGQNAAEPFCLNIEVSFGWRLVGRALQHICAPPPAPCPTPLGGAVVVLMPRSMWTKQSTTDFTPPDRILTTISGDGGPGRWEFRGLPTDEDYRVFVIPGLDPEMVYAPAFYELLNVSSLPISRNTNSCPEYRRTVPESDPFLLSGCEVMAPADDIILEARDRVFR